MTTTLSSLLSEKAAVLVTGAAGFIGMHVAARLAQDGCRVVGVDNFNAYYDVRLKEARAQELSRFANLQMVRADLADADAVMNLFNQHPIKVIIHLAAQAGVRYSLDHPEAYLKDNIVAFGVLLEACRKHQARHLVYASSSSVYGANHQLPFSEDQVVDYPVSLYAATKKADELMAHSYSHLYRLPSTGLRFFTVYGPWGRPDMSPMLFAEAISKGRAIKVFNHGKMRRDFTFIDDIVEGVVRIAALPPQPHPISGAPYAVYNIGNNQSVELEHFIDVLAQLLGKPALRDYLPMQSGDVKETFADVARLSARTGFTPQTKLEDGLRQFVEWFTNWQELKEKQ